jgi:hypothetical protein
MAYKIALIRLCRLEVELKRLQKKISDSEGDDALRATAEYLATEQFKQNAESDDREQ